jgi:hypothetical protein
VASVTCDDTSNMSAILENSTDAQFPDNSESNGSNDNNSYLKRDSVQNDNNSKRHKNWFVLLIQSFTLIYIMF